MDAEVGKMNEETKIIRWHFYFSGQVQAVGFRYTAYLKAKDLGLTGWVRNLDDGRVEMEAQGEVSRIRKLLIHLKSTPPIHIEDYSVKEVPLKEKERKFSITGFP